MNNNVKSDWFQNVENRPHPWPGLNWLTTSICTSDVQEAVDFYNNIMKMVTIYELKDEKTGEMLFARIRYRGNNFVINKENWDFTAESPVTTGQVAPFVFYLYVDNVAMLTEEMRNSGAKIVEEPKLQFWGDLKARLIDPFGYCWDIAEKSNHKINKQDRKP